MDLNFIFRFVILMKFFAAGERIQIFSTDHPKITYVNSNYIKYANITANRYARDDPTTYISLHFETLYEFDNNVTVDFYFYQWLSHSYQRSFVEMHFKLCDLVKNDTLIGTSLRQGMFARPCPFPAGKYNLYNMSIPLKRLPANFPFSKGRLYCNNSVTDTHEPISAGYFDIEIKEIYINRKKKN